ncbi:MAG: ABC transporter ATP-binding protein, partial [Bacteroidota bacterium]|nr:ABC transporter ATP-binding protein [Bacteroidota bacterium]
ELEIWKQERKAAGNDDSKKKEKIAEKKVNTSVEKKVNKTNQNKEEQKELQKLQKHFQQLEQKIENLKKEKNILEGNLALPEIYSDTKKFTDAENLYNKKLAEIKNVNEEYEKLFEKIMEMENTISPE